MADSEGHERDTSPLLETKLFAPQWRSSLVPRQRLIERLDKGARCKLTLISAPAGFGKTTLTSEWLSTESDDQRRSGWLSLDDRDNDPGVFWSYFAAALQRANVISDTNATSFIRASKHTSIEPALTTLINDISKFEQDFTLVFDDYHSIEADAIHSAISFLIDHLPPQMRIAIVSRERPPLQLGLLRGRGELSELGPADLRFTSSEASTFLGDVMGLQLSEDDLSHLEARTEGWIAGLQLAALSMQGREDVSGFIRAFAGHNRHIVDYLAEEVLQLQDDEVRSFLLQTSVLDRMSGPLCDATTELPGSKEMLQRLERGNFFLIPLDDRREWYRYHHLFSDVLRARAAEEIPDRLPALHNRASDWYESNGYRPDAIHHALAARNFERAAVLVDLAWRNVRWSNEEETWAGWLNSLPESVIESRPILTMGNAWTLLFSGEFEAGAARLRETESLIRKADAGQISSDTHVADEAEYLRLPAVIESAWAFYSQGVGDSEATQMHAKRALDLLPEEDHFERAIPSAMVALSQLAAGNLDTAYELVAHSTEHMRKSGNESAAITASILLGEIRMIQGRIREAISLYKESIRALERLGGTSERGTADMLLGVAESILEQGDIGEARRLFARSADLGEHAAWEAYEFRSRMIDGRLHEYEGDLNTALTLYEDAERVATPSVMPDIRPVAAMKARIWVKQGRLAEAEQWANKQKLSVESEPTYLREYELITLAIILIAHNSTRRDDQLLLDVIGLLERLLAAAKQGGRTGAVIEILVQLSLAESARAETDKALQHLESAMTIAEPESSVRPFVAGGDDVRDLLRLAMKRGISTSYAKHLLSYFDGAQASKPTSLAASHASLPDPLTVRETEVLKLVASGLTNQEIADQLFISLYTAKRHVANIFSKLGSSHRTQAVKMADDLNLL